MKQVIDVDVRLRATVEVDEAQVLPVRMRIQERIEAVATVLDEYGVEYAADNVFRAQVRGEE